MQEKLIIESRDYAQALAGIMKAGGEYIHNGRPAKIVDYEVIHNIKMVVSDGSILGNTPGVYSIPYPETYVFTLDVG